MAIGIEEKTRENLKVIREEDKVDQLVRALTAQQMYKMFALVYANIFGSQIRFLRMLNARDIPHSETSALFNDLQRANPEFGQDTMDQYVKFLLVNGLVGLVDTNYIITETGRGFLEFLGAARLSEERRN